MATYLERLEGRSRSVDAHNQRVGRRAFFVDVRDPAAAISTVVAGEGGINSQFPGDGALIVDIIEHSQDAAGAGSEIVYNYSTDRRFTMPTRVDKDKQGYYTWSSSWTTTTVRVPAARRVKKVVGDGASAVTVDVWEGLEADSLPQPQQVVTVNVTVPSWGPDDSAIIDNQTGVLHKPNGSNSAQYLFEGASVSRRGDGLYDVVYQYRGDTYSYPSDDVSSDPDFVRPAMPRPPWTDYYMKPSIDPRTTPPTFGTKKRFLPVNDNGHTLLPGWPL